MLRALDIDRHSWRASAKNVGARWLEVSFGWVPLLHDIDDLVQNAINPVSEPLTFTVKGKAWEEIDDAVSVRHDTAKRSYVRSGRRGYTASMVVEVDDAWFRAGKQYGIKALPLAWELAPFSFLIDYLAPIGDWLDAQSAMDGIRFVSGSTSYLYDATHKEWCFGDWKYGDYSVLFQARTGFKLFHHARIRMTEPPTASLGLTVPLTSWKRAGNVISLLLQTLRKIPPKK